MKRMSTQWVAGALALAGMLGIGANVQAAFVTPVGVTASSSWSGSPVVNLINNSGLSANNAAGTHDNQSLSTTMWMSNGGTVANEWIVFDLGVLTDLTQAYIWQMNQGHAVNAGGARNTRTLGIYVSSDNVSYTQVGGTVTLGVADGSNPALPAETVPLPASNVRYVKFDILTAGSGNTTEYVGLSEVRFESRDGAWSVPAVSDVTATTAQASAVTDTALDQARLLWDTEDKGTDDPADWTGNLSLGAQAADATVSGQMTGLAADSFYTFRFYGEHGVEADWSPPRTFATALSAAQTPAFTSAESPDYRKVELTWQDNAATETGYVLQRSHSGSAGPYDVIATLAANTTSYTDTTVSATTTYHYRLAAVNADNESSTDPAACQTSVTTAEYDPNVALVAYWPLNDGPAGATVTVAQEVIGHPTYPAQNGVPNNSNATWFDDPERGIVFNTPSDNSLYGGIQEIYGDITWSVWAKTSGGGHILGNRQGTIEGPGWNSLTRANWRTWAGELSFTALDNDTWGHLAVRRSGTQTAVFRNGVRVNTGTRSGTFRGAFRIGGDAHHWGEGYTGLISEAAVWTEALSDERILDLANGGPVIIPPPGGTIIMIR